MVSAQTVLIGWLMIIAHYTCLLFRNFEGKFIIDRKGSVIIPGAGKKSIESEIKALLEQPVD